MEALGAGTIQPCVLLFPFNTHACSAGRETVDVSLHTLGPKALTAMPSAWVTEPVNCRAGV